MSIPSGSLATLNLTYRAGQVANPLDAMGFVAPATENKTLLACSFSSTKFAGRAPEGKVLIRAFAGGEAASRAGLRDEELTRKLTDELRPVLGISGEPEEKSFIATRNHCRIIWWVTWRKCGASRTNLRQCRVWPWPATPIAVWGYPTA